MKTCLYDNGTLDLRSLLCNGSTMDTGLASALIQAVIKKPENGYIAEENSQGSYASMAGIDG